jgi:hypothetical protein
MRLRPGMADDGINGAFVTIHGEPARGTACDRRTAGERHLMDIGVDPTVRAGADPLDARASSVRRRILDLA